MSQQAMTNEGIKFLGRGTLGPAAMAIPVQFNIDLPLSYPIKIHEQDSMTPLTSEKSLIPALFQMAALADDPHAMPVLKGMLTAARMPLADTMLNMDKLEEVLKNVARRKRQIGRRILVAQS